MEQTNNLQLAQGRSDQTFHSVQIAKADNKPFLQLQLYPLDTQKKHQQSNKSQNPQAQPFTNEVDQATPQHKIKPQVPIEPQTQLPQTTPKCNQMSQQSEMSQQSDFIYKQIEPAKNHIRKLNKLHIYESQSQKWFETQAHDTIFTYLSPLFRGILLIKYCYNTFKCETVILTISENLSFMSLYNRQKKSIKVYPLNSIESVEKGVKTKRLQQYVNKKYCPKEDKYFSLISKERSFDFFTDSQSDRDSIVKYFKVALKMIRSN